MIELKGKPLSLGAKILAVVIVLGGLIMKGLGILDIDVDDLLKVGAFVVLIFAPIDASLLAGNIFGKKALP